MFCTPACFELISSQSRRWSGRRLPGATDMTNARIQVAAAGVACFLAVGTTAEAAKGVKKAAAPDTPRTVAGEVLRVTHHNGGASFHVRTAYHHKKRGMPSQGASAGVQAQGQAQPQGQMHHHGHEFNATTATHIEHANGTPATLAALHQGERVRVQAVGHQASNVQIISHQRMHGTFNRSRARMYHPHYHNMQHRRR
jgi:hypothetical protein